MAHSCYFLDWLEPPAAPWDAPRSKYELLHLQSPPPKYKEWLPQESQVWYRNDGFFIFELNFAGVAYSALSGSDRDKEKFADHAIEIASHASEMIKDQLLSPRTLPDTPARPQIDYERARQTFRNIEAKPIKLSTSSLPDDKSELLNKIKDNAWLRKLNARIRDNPSGFFAIGDEVPAVLFLRRTFGRSYGKALAVRQDFKASRTYISFSLRPVSNQPQPRQILSFPRFGFGRTFVSFMVWLSVALFFRQFMPDHMHDMPFFKTMLVGPRDWDDAIFFYIQGLFFVAAAAYVRVIYVKRRRTLEAYDRAVGTLQLGNYYQGVLKQIINSAPTLPSTSADTSLNASLALSNEEPIDFEMLIARMNDHKRVELEKRDSNLWWIYRTGAAGFVCFLVANELTAPIVWFLSTEGMQNILQIMSGSLPDDLSDLSSLKAGGGR